MVVVVVVVVVVEVATYHLPHNHDLRMTHEKNRDSLSGDTSTTCVTSCQVFKMIV